MASGAQLNKSIAVFVPVKRAALFGNFRAYEVELLSRRVVPECTTKLLSLPPDRLGHDILDVTMDQSLIPTKDVAKDSSALQPR